MAQDSEFPTVLELICRNPFLRKNVEARAWAKRYGRDVRRAWVEASDGRYLTAMAIGLGATQDEVWRATRAATIERVGDLIVHSGAAEGGPRLTSHGGEHDEAAVVDAARLCFAPSEQSGIDRYRAALDFETLVARFFDRAR